MDGSSGSAGSMGTGLDSGVIWERDWLVGEAVVGFCLLGSLLLLPGG